MNNCNNVFCWWPATDTVRGRLRWLRQEYGGRSNLPRCSFPGVYYCVVTCQDGDNSAVHHRGRHTSFPSI